MSNFPLPSSKKQTKNEDGAVDKVLNVKRVTSHELPMIDRKPWFSIQKSGAEGRKEMFNLTTHSTHFIHGYMASDI